MTDPINPSTNSPAAEQPDGQSPAEAPFQPGQNPPGATPSPDGRTPLPYVQASPRPFPKMSFGQFIVALFIYPRLAILNARFTCAWFRCLFILVAAAVLATTIHLYNDSSEYNQTFQSAENLLAGHLVPLVYSPADNWLEWGDNSPVDTFSNQTFRLDTADRYADFDTHTLETTPEDRGLIVTHDSLVYWLRQPESTQPVFFNVTRNKIFADTIRVFGEPRDRAYALTAPAFSQLWNYLRKVCFISIGIQSVFNYLFLAFTCVFFFSLVSLVCRHRDPTPFSAIIASSFACIIPPFLLTLALSFVPWLNITDNRLSNAFTIFFVIYLIVITFDRSVVIRTTPPDQRS